MRTACAAAFLLGVLGCGAEPPPPKKSPATAPVAAAPKAAAVKNDPSGKYACIQCNIRTNEATCPGCKTPLAAAPAAPAAPKTGGEVGKSTTAPRFACPKADCEFKDARKGTCIKHSDTQMIEEWFACQACSVKQPEPGKCGKCGAALKSTVK